MAKNDFEGYDIKAWTIASRAAQGLPPTITNPEAHARAMALVRWAERRQAEIAAKAEQEKQRQGGTAG